MNLNEFKKLDLYKKDKNLVKITKDMVAKKSQEY
jgi:hypothetical protein